MSEKYDMESKTNISLNLQIPNYSVVVYAVQGDVMSREITALLYDGQTAFTPPVGALGTVRYMKPDGSSGFYDTLEDEETVAVTWEGNAATIRLAEQALTVAGDVIMQLSFYSQDAQRLSAFNFRLCVEKNPLSDEEFESTDYYSVLTARIASVLGAVAHAPQINESGHWVLWDEEAQEYYDSGVNATGPQGIQGETGATGAYMADINRISGTGAAGTSDVYEVELSDGRTAGTFNVYNGADGQGAPGSATPQRDGTASAGSANAYSREDHVHPINVVSTMPEMDGVGSAGTAGTYARSDHIHPKDTSKADVTDVEALQEAAQDKVLYFYGIECSAVSGNFVTISDGAITTDHVLTFMEFADSSKITTDVTWITADGSLALSGTCSAATTVDIVLVKKDN